VPAVLGDSEEDILSSCTLWRAGPFGVWDKKLFELSLSISKRKLNDHGCCTVGEAEVMTAVQLGARPLVPVQGVRCPTLQRTLLWQSLEQYSGVVPALLGYTCFLCFLSDVYKEIVLPLCLYVVCNLVPVTGSHTSGFVCTVLACLALCLRQAPQHQLLIRSVLLVPDSIPVRATRPLGSAMSTSGGDVGWWFCIH